MKHTWTLLPLFLASSQLIAANEIHIVAQEEELTDTSAVTSSSNINQSNFPADIEFSLEAFYPAQKNQLRAKKDMRYSCVDSRSGQRLAECFITIDPPIARENTGGHHDGHSGDRPAGEHVPSSGWVSRTDGYLKSTYYSSEVAGVVDVVLSCNALIVPCRGGFVAFGVGVQGLEDLGMGVGYVLTGDKTPHPSNHWGVPAFLAGSRAVAMQFFNDYPDTPLLYNDISLEYGGVFDVATRSAAGYDWNPPHSTHRLGTNMDIGIPAGQAKRQLALRLFSMAGIRVLQEDQYHWHLSY